MGFWAFIFGCIGIGIAIMAVGAYIGDPEIGSFERLADTLFTAGLGMFFIGLATLAYALVSKK